MSRRKRAKAASSACEGFPDLSTAFASVTILLTYVLPKFGSIFAQAGQSLPFSARMLLGMSELMRSYWWAGVIVIGLTTVGVVHFLRTPAGRMRWDQIKLRIILIGDLTRKVAVARFARTLGTLLRSGVPMLQALEIVRDVVGNLVISNARVESRRLAKLNAKAGHSRRSGPVREEARCSRRSRGRTCPSSC